MSLDRMLAARSVAVIGASGRAGSVGEQTLRQLVIGGFQGAIYPVNPGYDELMGMRCWSGIEEIPEPVDLAVLAVGNTHLESETARVIDAGASSLTIFASCHGTASDGEPLRRTVTDLADGAGVPICGGNGMGFVNLDRSLRVCGFYQPELLRPGGITFLTHSGSLFSAMLHNRRGLAFNLVVSTGLELNTPMSAYMEWALDLPGTAVIAMFLETIRDPSRFTAALERAAEADIPVVALKVGATSRGQAAVATHSEAIAGADAVYEALFDRFGVHRVSSMDEMTDTLELLSSVRPRRPGGLGAVHDSGGERALLIDMAGKLDVDLPDLAEPTVVALEGLLDPGLEAANPVDAWGTGRDADDVFVGCMRALAADPAIGVVAFSVDLTAEEDRAHAYGGAALAAAAGSEVPIVVLANMTSTVDPAQADRLRAGGVPVLEGTETGLRAIRHLLQRADRSTWPDPPPRLTPIPSADLADPHDLLDHYGIRSARPVVVNDMKEAMKAAEEIGYPVVLKTTGSDHKSDVTGVLLDIDGPTRLRSGYEDLSRRLGPRVAVSARIAAGVEIGVGMITDPQFGPVVVISAGGTLIEVLADSVAVLPPVGTDHARRALRRLQVAKVLDGVRGGPAADVDILTNMIARFSELAIDQADRFSSIDLNPVIAGPDSAMVVDVLMKER